MVRTKSQIRNAKSKGASHEYDSQESLAQLPKYKNIFRTSERGFCLQYDLQSDFIQGVNNCENAVFECKRLKGMSWNQAKKFLDKLEEKKPEGYVAYLLFKSNQQPCLVMYYEDDEHLQIREFSDVFGVSFIKHSSTRSKK